MTEPRERNVEHRVEHAFELPGTPEQVWAAIATSEGLASWFVPTDIDGRVGGEIVTHMGPDSDSRGVVLCWEPPRRLSYQEEWAALSGHEGANVTPLVTEFVVEAKSGGTCVLKLVSSAFGTGADWEQEFFEGMDYGWMPYFDNLRLYLTNFPGQRATSLSVTADLTAPVDRAWPAVRDAVGAGEVGEQVKVNGVAGHVERMSSVPDAGELLLALSDPVPGYLGVYAFRKGDGETTVSLQGYLFSDEAPAYVERETASWQAWLDSLAVRPGVG